MAEGGGFEPPVRVNRTTDFESAAFDHSATLPIRTFAFYTISNKKATVKTRKRVLQTAFEKKLKTPLFLY